MVIFNKGTHQHINSNRPIFLGFISLYSKYHLLQALAYNLWHMI